jgi:7,8-dihydropterin-6-yl-methyl-4-(beta-D-ribofuranosyl)aminobenzene 5'-phosphate synthase
MIGRLAITVLSENAAGPARVLAEHGLALWIEADAHRILFDTGQGLVLQHNADELGVDLAEADAVVISHGHFDHLGGLPSVLDRLSNARLFVHPGAFVARYSRHGDHPPEPVGATSVDLATIQRAIAEVVLTEEPTAVVAGVHVTGPIPRVNDFEDTGGAFFLDRAGTQPDPIGDDQALFVATSEGVVVFVGCAHAGTVNTLEYVAALIGQERIFAIVGGMHLIHASQRRLSETAGAIDRLGVRQIGPCHCSGGMATARLAATTSAQVLNLAAGSRVRIV